MDATAHTTQGLAGSRGSRRLHLGVLQAAYLISSTAGFGLDVLHNGAYIRIRQPNFSDLLEMAPPLYHPRLYP